ncbi:MAG: RelA/SpoT domain-containing protein [Desulfoprunum sp.]|nr:RelA/SpoT domain-containing protein [Desulfoprunum sp.]
MKKRQKEAILISFLQEKGKYKKLAEYITHLIQDDPSSPKESLHTIIYRLKDELRLIEKINMLNNARLDAGTQIISKKNYQECIGDLLGVRIICLRLADIQKIEAYLKLLSEENILHFVKGPEPKKSFILPVAPGESIQDGTDLRYTGYSSIHYQVQLGENCDAPPELKELQFELQLRTILEEAWSEIDHKYRYVRSRTGLKLPEHIHAGFYNLSAYLQVAAHQAEYLCRSAEAYTRLTSPKVKGNAAIPPDDTTQSIALETDETPRNISSLTIEAHLEEIFGVKVTLRTLIYIEKRLRELNLEETEAKTLRHLFKKNRLVEFKAIFQEIMSSAPFVKEKECSIDAINALNFAIFYELEGKRVAQEGLRVVLRWRKNR